MGLQEGRNFLVPMYRLHDLREFSLAHLVALVASHLSIGLVSFWKAHQDNFPVTNYALLAATLEVTSIIQLQQEEWGKRKLV